MNNKFQFTKSGFDSLKKELDELIDVARPKAVDRLKRARSMGDLSENSEYHAAKEELAFVEGRIKEVEELLKNGQIIDPEDSEGIAIGSEVRVEKDGVEEVFHIVGEFEADPLAKKLSATSPIGKALLGKKEGDIVSVEVPAGTLKYKILNIQK